MIGHLAETPVTTVRVDWVCDCGGKMRPTGICYSSDPPLYPHRCEACGKESAARDVVYPRFEHREASGEGELISERALSLAVERSRVAGLDYATVQLSDVMQAIDERLGRAAVKK